MHFLSFQRFRFFVYNWNFVLLAIKYEGMVVLRKWQKYYDQARKTEMLQQKIHLETMRNDEKMILSDDKYAFDRATRLKYEHIWAEQEVTALAKK